MKPNIAALPLAMALMAAATPAAAYPDYIPMIGVAYQVDVVGAWSKYVRKDGAAPVPAAPSTTIAAARSRSDVPAKIAAAYPAERRAEVERVFGELLDGYPKFERQYGIPPNDVAGAVATFIGGSYEAYRNAELPDDHFKQLVAQMRGLLAGNADFKRASDADKRALYEHMAILGVFMAGTRQALQKQPNAELAASMQRAGRGYLEQFLKTDADRITISASGLQVR
jgi:hypothetical protein